MTTLAGPDYLLEHDWEQEPERLALLEQHADPVTIERLEATGLGPGWRCLELGAGRGSIAEFLAQRVGPHGHVTALDLDTSLLGWLDEPNVDVVSGDVLEIELDQAPFDLIHCRCVLMHIPARRQVIERLASWLRPGGWLVVEELDSFAMMSDPDCDRVAIFRAYDEALPTIDFECGRALLSELRSAGLTQTRADVRVDVVEGQTARARWDQLSLRALADKVLDAGTATSHEIETQLARLSDPDYRGFGWAWIGARGRRSAPA